MKITNTKISELIFAEYNPRQLKKDQFQQIKDSITRFGIVDPIIVNSNKERKNIIIGGHQRIKVALDMGIEEVPCHFIDLTYEKERELNIRLNKNTGEWDWDMLANHFDVEELTEWGFVDDELQFYEPEIGDGLTDDDSIPEDVETITNPGDLWILGEHRVLCGDATISTDVERLMDGQKEDMVFTDPPYNIDYEAVSDKRDKIKNDKMEDSAFVEFLTHSLTPCEIMYVCCSWQNAHLFKEAMNMIERKPKAMIVWDKVNPARHLDKYYKQHELIFYHGDFGGNKTLRGDVWQLKRERNTVHPTMKPVELIQMAISDNPKGNLVYDAFLGSGSTLIAAEKTGRKCYGMELDPHYCDVIVKRWEDFTGKKAELAD